MVEEGNRDERAVVFVYNAESGLLSAVGDMSRKIFSPETYQCNLCALTYSTSTMRKGWKQFLETLGRPSEFLHADELGERYNVSGVPLPAVFTKEGRSLKLRISASEIQQCRTLDDLIALVRKRVL